MFAPEPDTPAWLADLNPEQRSAVLHDGGPLLVVAGAGSGKTRTLAARVARLIADGAQPDRIMLLTFTRRAAAEMLRRAAALSDRVAPGRVWGGTFHSVANRLLRRHGDAVGLLPGFTVVDQGDAESLFSLVRAELGVADGSVRFPKPATIAAIYSRVVNAQIPLSETLPTRFPWCADHADALKEVFQEYTRRKRAQGVADYDDLLLYWRALLESPSGATVRDRFDHVLVDEYQDTNRIQADILKLLCGADGNLTVVGDDAQAIYSFRAADVANILGFKDEYPGAELVVLEENYRSTPEILAATNAVINGAERGFPKQLRSRLPSGAVPQLVTCVDPEAEADYVCDRVLERREARIELRDQGVLFRTGHHSDALEVELARRRIPYVKFGGLKFLEAAHVKDLLAMLRILDNPKDELAWHRVLQTLPGVGPATAQRIMAQLVAYGGDDPERRLNGLMAIEPAVRPESQAPLDALRSGVETARGQGSDVPPPGVQIEALLPFCATVFDHVYDDSGARLADLEMLATLASGYEDRSRFISELVLDPPRSTSDLAGPPMLDDDYLILSTIHSAKGAEWEAVYVIHAADGSIPSDMALSEPGGVDEERRIFYVALTRAKRYLDVTVPQRFYHHRSPSNPNHSYAIPSRYLRGMDGLFEVGAAGVPPADDPAATALKHDPVAPVLDMLFE